MSSSDDQSYTSLDKQTGLSDTGRHSCDILMLQVSLKLLLAEIASINRDSKEAQIFLTKFSRTLNGFVDLVSASAEKTDLTKSWDNYSRKFIDDLISGISFEKTT